MSVEFHRGSPGKLDSRTLSRETLSRWTRGAGALSDSITGFGQYNLGYSVYVYIYIYIYIYIHI